jgi:type II secretory pathway component GspD/PulD (secretin)
MDLPFCKECTQQVEQRLVREVSDTQREVERYQAFTQQLRDQGLTQDSVIGIEQQMNAEIAAVC